MKISDVCQKTGLTKRAIRFYTEKGLITPVTLQKEHRDHYEYSDEDVNLLKAISVLRKLDISVDDISKIITCPDSIADIVSEYREKSRERYEEISRIGSILSDIDVSSCADIYSLARSVEMAGRAAEIPQRDTKLDHAVLDDLTEAEKKQALMQMHDESVLHKHSRNKMIIALKMIIAAVMMLAVFAIIKFRPISFEFGYSEHGMGYIYDGDDENHRIISGGFIDLYVTTYFDWDGLMETGEIGNGDRYAKGSFTLQIGFINNYFELDSENNEVSYSHGVLEIYCDDIPERDGRKTYLRYVSYNKRTGELCAEAVDKEGHLMVMVFPKEVYYTRFE